MKKENSTTANSPHSLDVPTFFADQPAAFQTGPYTTKITLGSIDDDGTDFPRPVITIVMPTINFIRMVEEFNELITSEHFKNDSKRILNNDINHYYQTKSVTAKKISQKKIG